MMDKSYLKNDKVVYGDSLANISGYVHPHDIRRSGDQFFWPVFRAAAACRPPGDGSGGFAVEPMAMAGQVVPGFGWGLSRKTYFPRTSLKVCFQIVKQPEPATLYLQTQQWK